MNLEHGLPSALQVRDRGRTVEVDGTTYILLAPEQCAAATTPAEGSCLANAVACLDNRHEATPATLEAGCREGVPGMCLQLADRWHEEANLSSKPILSSRRRPSTPPCPVSSSPLPVTTVASNRNPGMCRRARGRPRSAGAAGQGRDDGSHDRSHGDDDGADRAGDHSG
ncbi:hypothetical protein VM57_19320 [Stenotrophomonas maltophilia]|uniref:Uncharacterized protein n=1 Tax=Stenotrophomonas maltophilia TaxID=40324 RepID=A0A0F5ZM40_STEMA|nr:hypothetical protein VM57_19320 [Stenotrophomonas maltophilia]